MKTNALIIVSIVVLLLAVGLVFSERKKTDVRHLMLIAVMTAMSVAGRFIFAFIPGFKPVTAVVVLAGMYLGCEAGYLCGALTALISNFYFGQGPFTPFQMLVWGGIGIAAALMSGLLKKSKIALVIFGILSGILFSLLMDIYTVIWSISQWSLAYYLVCITNALPFTIMYAVSNVVFLLALSPLFGKKLSHATAKYMEKNV